jgi:hypothetical protein
MGSTNITGKKILWNEEEIESSFLALYYLKYPKNLLSSPPASFHAAMP